MIHSRRPQSAQEFCHQFAWLIRIFVSGDGCLKITWIRQSVGADGAEIRQLERRAEILAHITAGRGARIARRHPKAQAARNHGDLLRFEMDAAKFGVDAKRLELRNDEQLTVGTVEKPARHWTVEGV